MKKLFLTFATVAICFTQPLLAGNSHEGGEKQKQREANAPQMGQPLINETQSATPMEAIATPQNIVVSNTEVVNAHPVAEEVVATPVIKKQHKSIFSKILKPHRAGKKHEVGSLFGILSFVFGLIAFAFAWAVWPLGLTLAILAIVFGILGLSGDYTGRTLALIGLILGILTLILPVGIYWVVVAH